MVKPISRHGSVLYPGGESWEGWVSAADNIWMEGRLGSAVAHHLPGLTWDQHDSLHLGVSHLC
jgi:hypothetical protein